MSGVRYGQLPVEAGDAGCYKTNADGICRESQEIAGIVGRIRHLRRIRQSVQMPDATLARLIWPTLMQSIEVMGFVGQIRHSALIWPAGNYSLSAGLNVTEER